MNDFSKHLNCKEITGFIVILSNRLYYKEEYYEINKAVISTFMKLKGKNYKELQRLVNNISIDTFNKNKVKLYKLLNTMKKCNSNEYEKVIKYVDECLNKISSYKKYVKNNRSQK